MPKPFHKHLGPRLQASLDRMQVSFGGGRQMSNATKGQEREIFVDEFLRWCFPPIYRFSSGDITDTDERRSGQVDIVVQHPFFCSFPLTESGPRLFLAESVGCVIEVKSSLSGQWNQILKTAHKVKSLQRRFDSDLLERDLETLRYMKEQIERETPGHGNFMDQYIDSKELALASAVPGPGTQIPFYVVGFGGWSRVKSIQKHFDDAVDGSGNRLVDGILQLDKLWYRSYLADGTPHGRAGLYSLLAFLSAVEDHFTNRPKAAAMERTYTIGTFQSRHRRGIRE